MAVYYSRQQIKLLKAREFQHFWHGLFSARRNTLRSDSYQLLLFNGRKIKIHIKRFTLKFLQHRNLDALKKRQTTFSAKQIMRACRPNCAACYLRVTVRTLGPSIAVWFQRAHEKRAFFDVLFKLNITKGGHRSIALAAPKSGRALQLASVTAELGLCVSVCFLRLVYIYTLYVSVMSAGV